MKIAMTGANGFVGRHVLHALKPMDVNLVSVVRPGTGQQEHLSGTEIVELDIMDHEDAFERMGRPDGLLHLAWGGLPNYQARHHLEVELPAHRSFLATCVRSGIKHIVVSGTCLEYGMQSGQLHERMPNSPATAYGLAKDSLRRELQGMTDDLGFELTWLRIFYTYGSGQMESSLYTQLQKAVSRGDQVFHMSEGDQVRDFIPIEEASRIIATLAARIQGAGIVNVCSGRPTSVKELVEQLLRMWSATIELRLGVYPYPDYEPFAFWGCRKKLDQALAPGRLA